MTVMAGVKRSVDHCQIDRNSFAVARARRDVIGGIKTKLQTTILKEETDRVLWRFKERRQNEK